MQFDFHQAKMMHLNWKVRLRDYLDGRTTLTDLQAGDHRECELGRWLRSGVRQHCSALPEMRVLDAVHEQLHAVIRNVVRERSLGNRINAEAVYLQIQPLSRELIKLLDMIEKKTAKAAGSTGK